MHLGNARPRGHGGLGVVHQRSFGAAFAHPTRDFTRSESALDGGSLGPVMKENSIRRAVREGRAALGTGLKEFASRGIPWIIEAAGFDYCAIDHEHGRSTWRPSPIWRAGSRPRMSRPSFGSTS